MESVFNIRTPCPAAAVPAPLSVTASQPDSQNKIKIYIEHSDNALFALSLQF